MNSIAVVICTYNGELYIESQLESILVQSVLPEAIYVFDDGSTDETVAIIKRVKSLYKGKCKINISVNENNLGYRKNFLNGILKPNQNIIFLADQDDIWDKKKIEIILTEFERTTNIDVIFSDAYIVDEKMRDKGFSLCDHLNLDCKLFNKSSIEILLKRNYVTGATLAFKKEMIHNMPKIFSFEHDALIGIYSAINNRIKLIENKLIYYRQHENNQLGIRKVPLIQKIRHYFTAEIDIQHIEEECDSFHRLIEHCVKNEIDYSKLQLLKGKLKFLKLRCNIFRREKNVLLEVIKNYRLYSKFSSGFTVFVRDLIFVCK